MINPNIGRFKIRLYCDDDKDNDEEEEDYDFYYKDEILDDLLACSRICDSS